MKCGYENQVQKANNKAQLTGTLFKDSYGSNFNKVFK